MAFTRFSSDRDVLEKKLCESTFTGLYHLNTPGNGLQMPFVDDPHVRLQKWGANLYTNGVLFNKITAEHIIKDILTFLNILKKHNCIFKSVFNYWILSTIPIFSIISKLGSTLGPELKKEDIMKNNLLNITNYDIE